MTKSIKKFITTTLFSAVLFAGGNTVSASEASVEVLPGDTLGEIAKAEAISLDKLIEMNPQISNPHLIFPGETVELAKSNVVQNDSSVVSNNEGNTSVVSTSYETDLLARLVEAEAKGESFEGKVAVAEVVLNRVQNGNFPNSIEAVVYQTGQFSPVTNGAIYKPATDVSIEAVKVAVNNGGNASGALYFYNPTIAGGQAWFNTLETVGTIGNHVFKR